MNSTPNQPPRIELLIQRVRQSGKYAQVSEEVIRRIGLRQLAARSSLADAVDATKSKLHQIAGAYLDSKPHYASWLSELTVAHGAGGAAFRSACARILQQHASTRERCGQIEEFYVTLLAPLAPVRSVLDVGCGLNPLALPWMNLAPDAVYYACDIHADMMKFLSDFFPLAGVEGKAEVRDVVSTPPPQLADVALVLKLLPVLDQQAPRAGLTLLRELRARSLIVSFPTRTLCGRKKGMEIHYAARFQEMIREEPWQIEPYSFPNELCFRIWK